MLCSYKAGVPLCCAPGKEFTFRSGVLVMSWCTPRGSLIPKEVGQSYCTKESCREASCHPRNARVHKHE